PLLLLSGAAARGHRALPRADRRRGGVVPRAARPHVRLCDPAIRARHAVRQGSARPSLSARPRGRRRRGRDLRRAGLAGAESTVELHNPVVGGTQRSPGARFGFVAVVLAGSVALSRVLGAGREMVLTRVLGAGAEADAYKAAFLLPDLLNYFLAGGALSIAFM